ncbi:MMPL family transporter [Nocardia sp. CA2R105]|uniref:MMPL family transporter n=1 Tax=Nocardia coffeae TaxID=2873381 RepID=UPI001CA6DBD4|nr:MMPL family transporter [Nocardia coffeae]MBY8861821.1 MMPL family transporter [Nocardia coffeae]
MGGWDRYAQIVSGRRGWLALLAALIVAGAVLGLSGGGSSTSAPNSLPDNAESAQVQRLLREFPGGDSAAAVLIVTRADGAVLTADDQAHAGAALSRMRAGAAGPDLKLSQDQRAAFGQASIPANLTGFALTDRIDALRTAVRDGAPADLRLWITGGPAFGADIADSFSGANTLLLAVTAAVVMVLLIGTYRSPVLWLIPLVVVAIADRVAAAAANALAQVSGLTFDGSTSGITSVLVFGAGTNYALLLVSRYRDELYRTADHRAALRIAVRRAGPAVLASNLTVVLALLTLLLALLPNTRGLGAFGALGLLVAAIFVLVTLPPALALFGRKVFWPFIPRVDGHDTAASGAWHTVAEKVVRRPKTVVAVFLIAAAACASALPFTHVGLAQSEQFRVHAESVDGLRVVSEHFSSGASDPTIVLARTGAAPRVQSVLDSTAGVVRATSAAGSANGMTRWSVVLDAAPASDSAFAAVTRLRTTLASVPDAGALVGGSDAVALDTRNAARHDQYLIMPLILAVVLLVLLILLRAIPAAILLVAVTVISALAALGIGSLLSTYVFGFPALDTNVPLFAFLFLVALGVDYTIFLVTRAREETPGHGVTGGIVRAVSATGGVITSAGIVLAAVFAVLGILPLITLTQLGIVVGVGILLDTFVVRTVAIPALFALIGWRIWWPGASRPECRRGVRTAPAWATACNGADRRSR